VRRRVPQPIVFAGCLLLHFRLYPILLQDPSRIYNLDETAFWTEASKIKVWVPKGVRSAKTSGGKTRDSLTLLLTINAAGKALRPMLIVKGAENGTVPTMMTKPELAKAVKGGSASVIGGH